MTKLLKLTIFVFTLLLVTNAIAQSNSSQTKYKGYQYNVNDDEFYPFKYTRKYGSTSDGFITTYNIYNPRSGRISIVIKATHIIFEKKIIVDVENPNGGIFSKISSEETLYKSASLSPFGYRGAAGAFGQRIPNQLMVKFASNKFQNIKVVHVNGTEAGSDNLIYYVLDEEN